MRRKKEAVIDLHIINSIPHYASLSPSFSWMILRISSCFSAEIPIASRASRVPQSGQISVVLSFRERAGASVKVLPQTGHTFGSFLSVFMLLSFMMKFKSLTPAVRKFCGLPSSALRCSYLLLMHTLSSYKSFIFNGFQLSHHCFPD